MQDPLNRRQVLAGATLGAAAMSAVARGAAAAAPAKEEQAAGDRPRIWGAAESAGPGVYDGKVEAGPSGEHLSLLFDRFTVELQGEESPLAESRAWAVRVPVTIADDRALLGYVQDLRFHVSKSDGAGVLIVGDFAGVPLVVDLPADQEAPPPPADAGGGAEEPAVRMGPGDMFREVFTLARRGAKGQYADPGAMPVVTPYAVTLLVSVRRRSPADMALVTIGSLDVRAVTEDTGHIGKDGK